MYFHQEIKGCLSKSVHKEGLSENFLKEVLPKLEKTHKSLQTHLQKKSLPLLSIPYEREDITALKDIALRIQDDYADVVVLGTGGSSLGAQALIPLADKKKAQRLHFPDNIDPKTFDVLLRSLNLKDTIFIVISKSGGAAETMMQCLTALQKIETEVDKSAIKNHFLIVTEPKKSSLRLLADHYGIPVLDHPPKLGGRFSVLSVVGLLPAMIAGINPYDIREGAVRVLDRLQETDTPDTFAPAIGAAINYLLAIKKGKNTSIMMPYVDDLQPFSFWYRQLWAESLGKSGNGTLPANALGAVDQHSQLQLYLDGLKDKLFTVIVASMENKGTILKGDFENIDKNLSYLKGATMGDLMEAEQRATIDTLIHNQCPTRVMEIPDLTPDFMGMLMMHFMLETIYTADLYGVNPFNQPAVEEGKILAKKYLSKTLKERIHG
jgi:glucose-6-phosphate isomerase